PDFTVLFTERSVRELNPIFRLTKAADHRSSRRCPPKHLQTITSVIPDGVEPSSPACRAGVVPFDHGIVEWPKSASNRQNHQPLDLAAFPFCVFGREVAGPGVAPGRRRL